MNKLEYYTRQKESWGNEELTNLKNEYQIKELNISEIADIHRRTPGSISYKLQHLGVISNNIMSRGYHEYRNSNLYKEIVEKGKKVSSSDNSNTSRRGKAWDEEEELQLLQAIRRKETHGTIAQRHQRSEGAIVSHLRQLACDYHFNESRPIEQIMKFTGLTKESIEDAIKIRQQIQNRKEQRQQNYSKPIVSISPRVDTQVELLREIRNIMLEMMTILRNQQERP